MESERSEVFTPAVGESARTSCTADELELIRLQDPNLPSFSGSKRVLEEEEYTEKLERIIERDFFPEIGKLQAQSEYLEALETNDMAKIKQLQMKYSRRRTDQLAPDRTPRNFDDTPITMDRDKREKRALQQPSDEDPSSVECSPALNPAAREFAIPKPVGSAGEDLPTLDRFLNATTSEDNESFQELVEEEAKRMQIKYQWMYDADKKHKERYEPGARLALPATVPAEGNKIPSVGNWKYNIRNNVLWVPNNAEWSLEDRVKRAKMAERKVVHGNTRFKVAPFRSTTERKDSMARAVGIKAAVNIGKVDAGGEELFGLPPMGDLGYAVTPSPAPGMMGEESPMMTWGEIEGTPFALDGSDTPITRGVGPTFKMPEVPKRDSLALSLAEDASKLHRQRKKRALNHVARSFATPKFGSGKSLERLSSMSPAARRLATSKLGIRVATDKALKASYTPSPLLRPSPRTTPILTPLSGAKKTPVAMANEPSLKLAGVSTPSTTKLKSGLSTSETISSLTDNLLDLPKKTLLVDNSARKSIESDQLAAANRAKAADFF